MLSVILAKCFSVTGGFASDLCMAIHEGSLGRDKLVIGATSVAPTIPG